MTSIPEKTDCTDDNYPQVRQRIRVHPRGYDCIECSRDHQRDYLRERRNCPRDHHRNRDFSRDRQQERNGRLEYGNPKMLQRETDEKRRNEHEISPERFLTYSSESASLPKTVGKYSPSSDPDRPVSRQRNNSLVRNDPEPEQPPFLTPDYLFCVHSLNMC